MDDAERLHEEITADYNDMIYAATREEVEVRRKAFIRKWRLKHRAVADSLEEAGARQWAGLRRQAAEQQLASRRPHALLDVAAHLLKLLLVDDRAHRSPR